LPSGCCTDAEFEKSGIFNRKRLYSGRESWVCEPGGFFSIGHNGEPIVVVHNRDRVLKAFPAVCRHRAMLVAGGRTRIFLCPYHHWVYSLGGQFIGALAMERARGFGKKQVRLAEFNL
jgi:phenylpropionate dioxygenase-like ring-hydroxylating dioxygenase large terminal subunit